MGIPEKKMAFGLCAVSITTLWYCDFSYLADLNCLFLLNFALVVLDNVMYSYMIDFKKTYVQELKELNKSKKIANCSS